jgi:CheY-like chemotaxis protein
VRILVVEDDESIRRLIAILVQARGYEVTSVSSGDEAIKAAASTPPDLVLLDLMLQGQYDGFEVCRRLRTGRATRHIPVIVITALDDEGSRARAAAAGATAYHTKPFASGALLEEIERVQKKG